jgi:hypothetical protein
VVQLKLTCAIYLTNGEGRAGHPVLATHTSRQATHKGCLAATQIAY